MFQVILEFFNEFFRKLLDAVPLHPRYYYGLIPRMSYEEIVKGYEEGLFQRLSGLAPSLTYCLFLSLARYILQHYVVNHLALWCMRIKAPKHIPNKSIDNLLPYARKQVYEPTDIKNAASELALQPKEIERYLTHRSYYHIVHRKIVKFVEAFWRATFYGLFSYIGYRTLFTPETASWIRDTDNNFKDWPYHPLLPSILFYYNVELGCYFHQLLWTNRNHSDVLEMTIHHLVTIALILASFLSNFYRIGSTILFIHDLSDVFLEAAKVFNYTSKPKPHRWMKATLVDGTFAVFAITFFVTRLVIYPYFVLGSVFTTGYHSFYFTFMGAYLFAGLLIVLQILHFFWFYLIARMIYRLALGMMEDDVRSDEEDEPNLDELVVETKKD